MAETYQQFGAEPPPPKQGSSLGKWFLIGGIGCTFLAERGARRESLSRR